MKERSGQDRRRAQRGAHAHGAHPATAPSWSTTRSPARPASGSATSSSWPACPPIMQAHARRGRRRSSRPAPSCCRKRSAPTPRKATSAPSSGAIAKAHPDTIIGSYPFFDEKLGPNTNIVVRSRDAAEARARPRPRSRRCWRESKRKLAGRTPAEAMVEAAQPTARRSPEKIFPVSWDQFHRDARALAWRLHGRGRSRPSSASPAAAWCRRRSSRANSTCADRDGLRRQLPGLQEPGRAQGAQGCRAGDHGDARRRARAC